MVISFSRLSNSSKLSKYTKSSQWNYNWSIAQFAHWVYIEFISTHPLSEKWPEEGGPNETNLIVNIRSDSCQLECQPPCIIVDVLCICVSSMICFYHSIISMVQQQRIHTVHHFDMTLNSDQTFFFPLSRLLFEN